MGVGDEYDYNYTGKFLDILAVSCDSFNEEVNRVSGRHRPERQHLASLVDVKNWCNKYHVAFKINSVVNTHNWEEDMSQDILELNPVRWKVRNTTYACSYYNYSGAPL